MNTATLSTTTTAVSLSFACRVRILPIHCSVCLCLRQIYIVAAAVQIPIDLRLYGTGSAWAAMPWLLALFGVAVLYGAPRLPLSAAKKVTVTSIPPAAVILTMFLLASHAAAGVAVAIGGTGTRVVSGWHYLRVVGLSSAATFVSQWQLASAM